jgi:FMN phosphatase YigB (HAD superfamily)
MIKAVLFDLENTLVQRQSYFDVVERALLNAISRGRDCTMLEADLLFHSRRKQFSTTTATLESLGIPKSVFQTRLNKIQFKRPVQLTDGALHALNWLDTREVMLGLLTNMPKRMVLKIIKAGGIPLEVFTSIVTGSDVLQTKPCIEPFIKALNQLNLPAEDCMMVGDREEVDLDPAKKLGMTTVLLGGKALKADYTISSLDQLIVQFQRRILLSY